MDMGQHVVQDYAQPLTLHQIMVPGLEDRARTFPALSTAKQLSPGYFDAPGTKQAALGTAWGQGIKTELPLVTLVFSAVDGLKAMRGTGRSGCRAWDDPVQGRNTALVTQYRGIRVPGGRRQLHAGGPLPHEGCAVLLTGRQLLLYRWTIAAYRWSMVVVGTQALITG
ncbi:TPA: hypothetical protein ACH3X1_013430 [Trebouxia sp. C0004]